MTLRPIGFRVFVQPDPVATDIGGILIPDASYQPKMSGTVIAVGPGGSQMRHAARTRGLKDACEVVESTIRQLGPLTALTMLRDEIAGLIGTADPEREVHIGDRVYFDAFVGRTIRIGDNEIVELTEDDISAVDTAQGVAA